MTRRKSVESSSSAHRRPSVKKVRYGRAPSHTALHRPDRPEIVDLVDDLLDAEPTVWNPLATLACMTACAWVYTIDGPPPAIGPELAIATMLGRIGLEDAHTHEITIHNAGMLVASTAVFVQSACGRVGILCYRGTEAQNPMNWMTDFDVNPTRLRCVGSRGEGDALVHSGFLRNLDATWPFVVEAVERAIAGKHADPKTHGSLEPLEALYVTGHSLGAAMAALAGVQFALDPVWRKLVRSKLRGIYTFGQPMIGSPDFAAACSEDLLLRDGIFRHIYANDIVPRVPAIESGPFTHFGREFRATEGTGWREHKEFVLQAPDLLVSVVLMPQLMFVGKETPLGRRLPQHGYSWYDHMPPFYLKASEISKGEMEG